MKTRYARQLKVYYSHLRKPYRRIPMIRLCGHYLADLDFNIGDSIEVTMKANEISIKKVLPSKADIGSAEAKPIRNTLV